MIRLFVLYFSPAFSLHWQDQPLPQFGGGTCGAGLCLPMMVPAFVPHLLCVSVRVRGLGLGFRF